MLAFLFKNPGKLRVDETDDDPEKTKKLNAFKKKLEERRIVKYWEDGSQLANDIKDSINDIVRRRPGVGWIRGDQALDPTVYKELEAERRQNKELREKLEAIGKAEIVFPSHLEHGSDLFEIEFTVSERSDDNKIINKYSDFCYISWDMLIDKLSQLIYLEKGEDQILRRINDIVKKERCINDELSVNVGKLYLEQVRYQLEALDLIVAVSKEGDGIMGIHTTYIAWRLTDTGRRYISNLRALKRPAVKSPSLP